MTAPGPAASREGSALAVLGALADRSWEIVGECADARRYNRGLLAGTADIWDNNTLPFFRAAESATPWTREFHARTALRWMADLGTERQAWIRECAAAAGLAIPVGLPRQAPYDGGPEREYDGRVSPPRGRLTPALADGLPGDYDLDAVELRAFGAERAGERLDARLRVRVARRFPAPGAVPGAQAELTVHLTDVGTIDIDITDARSLSVRAWEGGWRVGLGSRGVLRAAGADLFIDDVRWHLSPSGRRADATLPRRVPRDRRRARRPPYVIVARDTDTAAAVMRWAMVVVRRVRFSDAAHEPPLAALHRTFAGAGADVIAAGTHFSFRRREAAYRELLQEWFRRGGPELVPVFREALEMVPHRPDVPGLLPDPAPAPPVPAPIPPGGMLRAVSYVSGHPPGESREDRGQLLVHLAVPPAGGGGERWPMATLEGPDPTGLRLRTEAFTGAAGLVREGGTLSVRDGALTAVTAGEWTRGETGTLS
ncbi:hypothetical protein [Streptomyces sp. NPDC021224]|uniref:hypothetical protein n=1 Tax=unclassified Streptomyces TaxID=2593676 RepID=UPI0037B2E624